MMFEGEIIIEGDILPYMMSLSLVFSNFAVSSKWLTYKYFVWNFCRQQFLEPGESVLMISMVKKIQKLTNKKVQLILTNKPRLIYVNPSKLVVKGNIIWSDNPNDLSIQVTSPSHFKICTVSSLSCPWGHVIHSDQLCSIVKGDNQFSWWVKPAYFPIVKSNA